MIELEDRPRKDAIASLQKYFDANMPEPIGTLPAAMLLQFFLEEIGPAIYNKAIADAQTRMHAHISDLQGELFEHEFQYWPKLEAKKKSRKLGAKPCS